MPGRLFALAPCVALAFGLPVALAAASWASAQDGLCDATYTEDQGCVESSTSTSSSTSSSTSTTAATTSTTQATTTTTTSGAQVLGGSATQGTPRGVSSLPITGGDVVGLTVFGALVLAAGGGTVVAGRRRSRRDPYAD